MPCLRTMRVVSAPQVNLLVPDATYNRVSISLCLYLVHRVFLPQSCALLSSLQSTIVSLSYQYVGQSCIHFISPSLVSNYPYQNVIILDFIDTLCITPKSNQANWHLIYHPHITKLFYLPNQNTMLIINNKTLT